MRKMSIATLRRAIKKAKPGEAGYEYVRTCEFIGQWVLGLALHTRDNLVRNDPLCLTPGTIEHAACERTVNDFATNELCEKSMEIGTLAPVVLQTTIFFNNIKPEEYRLDVAEMLYEGTVIFLQEKGNDPETVEAGKKMFSLLVRPVAGFA